MVPLQEDFDPNAPSLEFIENSKFTSHSGSACVRLVLGACESLRRMKGSARGKRDLKLGRGGLNIDSCGDSWAGRRGENVPRHVAMWGCLWYQDCRMETEAVQPEDEGQYHVTAILVSVH